MNTVVPEYDEQTMKIWTIHAWVGQSAHFLSTDTRTQIFEIALRDGCPDATNKDIGYALGLIG